MSNSIFNDSSGKTISVGTLESIDETSVAVNLGSDSGDDFVVDTNKLVVEGDTGFVGVGTASPTQLFHVEGAMVQDWVSRIKNTHSTSGQSYGLQVVAGTSASDVAFAVKNQSNSATYLEVQGDGKVGFGESAPGTQLQMTGTAPYMTLQNSTSENTAGGCESMIIFEDHANVALGQIEVSHVGTSDDTKGQLTLKTHTGSALTSALTISETQQVTIPGQVNFGGAASFDSALADEGVSGTTATFTAGVDLVRGEVVYFKSDGKMWKAVATAVATSRCVAMAAEDISAEAAGLFLLEGFCHDNGSFPAYTVGGTLYTPEEEVSENVPEQTAPDTDGDFVQVVGWAVTANIVYFRPDSTVIEVA